MNPVAKALWFIESHFGGEVTLAEIFEVAGVSRFHLVRAFGMTTGHSVMRYVRGRRLSEAARALAKGAPDILTVALDAGYGSHEAFTRAFRDLFGLTPGGTVENLLLVEPVTMDDTSKATLAAPRMEAGRALLVAGLGERFTFDNPGGLPALWQRFGEHLDHVPGQIGRIAYGVCYNTDDTGFDYIAGMEVADFASLPAAFARVRVSGLLYAVFTHSDHISSVRGTFMAITGQTEASTASRPLSPPAAGVKPRSREAGRQRRRA